MPCTYDDSAEREREANERRKYLDLLTRVACTVHSLLEESYPDIFKTLPKENLNWWREHQQEDRARAKREKAEKADRLYRLESERRALEAKIKKVRKE